MATDSMSSPSMDTLVGLCKRRGFVFPSSEVYGGYQGFFDFGPLGVEVKNNIKQAWWRDFVHRREDMVGLDSSIIMHPAIWKASGHVDGFSDPMVDCRETKARYRADQLLFRAFSMQSEDGAQSWSGFAAFVESEDPTAASEARIKAIIKAWSKLREVKFRQASVGQEIRDFTVATAEERAATFGPDASAPGTLTEPREFKLMFETKVGPLVDSSATAYLRPETAQGIFANFKNVVDTGRVRVPFGIAQIGKAFRNEITPRNFVFRSREFEQMEIEYFIAPDADWQTLHRQWIDTCINWLVSIGIPRGMISEYIHAKEKLAFYSQATTDLMFAFPHGVQELWGIACRSDYDLKQHQQHSGKSMEYFDEARKQAKQEPFRYVPHVIEPSLGVDRTFLAVMASAYTVDEQPDEDGKMEKREVLRFHPRIAPFKFAVFPLLKNKAELISKGRAVYENLSRFWPGFWDVTGSIGKRYRRQDEIGTPYCITIDFDTIEKNAGVTVRERDTCSQVRIHESELLSFLSEKLL